MDIIFVIIILFLVMKIQRNNPDAYKKALGIYVEHKKIENVVIIENSDQIYDIVENLFIINFY